MNTEVLRNKTAIVGIGSSNFGDMYRERDANRSAEDLGAAALRAALEDAGLAKSSIDGLCLMRIPSYQRFGSMAGFAPGQLRHVTQYEAAGRMSGVAVQAASMAIACGMAETIALVYGNNGRSVGARYGGDSGYGALSSYESVYGMTSPGAGVAFAYSRYVKDFNVPDDALAPVAISNRKFAINNELAVMRKELTYDEYMNSRYIAEPLRLFDYCLINDGAVAMIITSAERAADLRRPAVVIDTIGANTTVASTYQTPDNFWASATDVAERMWADSGLRPEDISVASFYDNFTPTVLFSLEAFGYCDRGSAWEFVRDGRIEAGGQLPLNTSGGHTSESYMQGWNHLTELVRQVRGESVNQVARCDYAHYACYSPITTSILFTHP